MADLATTVTVTDACGRTHVPVLLLSDPGMGKSSLVRGIAAAEGVLCEVVLGSLREPAEVAGMPGCRASPSRGSCWTRPRGPSAWPRPGRATWCSVN